jgi:thioredoxin-related protein
MDKTTFQDPKVQAYLAKNFVCMKVNAQDGADGEELAQKYEVEGFPTFMVFNSHGKPLGQFSGYRTPDQLLEGIQKSLAFHAPSTSQQRK